jgi:3-dehydroquinate dehydratase-2
MIAHNRIDVLHGVNLDQLGRRDPAHYGTLTLSELERWIEIRAHELSVAVTFFQSNYEGEMVERIHRVSERADGLIINAGAWTHYAWALHDALEMVRVPSVEVHLSDINAREPWRRISVLSDVCIATVAGKGADGYAEAMGLLVDRFAQQEAAK